MNVDGHYSELRLFKAWKFWIHETSAQYKLCRKTFTVSTMSHMSSKKHANSAGHTSRGSSSKGRMQLTSYLWKKIGLLWENYGKAMEFTFWGSVRTLIPITSLNKNSHTRQMKVKFFLREKMRLQVSVFHQRVHSLCNVDYSHVLFKESSNFKLTFYPCTVFGQQRPLPEGALCCPWRLHCILQNGRGKGRQLHCLQFSQSRHQVAHKNLQLTDLTILGTYKILDARIKHSIEE